MTDLKKLLDEATPGPWWVQAAEDSPKDISHVWRAPPNPHTYKGGQSQTWIATVLRSDYHGDVVSAAPKDAALICAAVNAVPELLALREEVKRYQTTLSDVQNFLLDRFAEWKRDNHPVFPDPEVDAVYTNVRAALNQEPGQ